MRDLRDVIARVRADGRQRNTRCPGHDDQRASLSVGVGTDGRIVLHCHAGCSFDVVVQRSGLAVADLRGRWVDDHRGRIVAEYDYTDEGGHLLYQVCRFEPKEFRQRRPNGNGGWTWKVQGVRRVLFGLPELQGHKFAYIAEGEKDVLALRKLGLVATTNASGAGKWRDEYAGQLRSVGVHYVAVLPDNDDAGRQHAATVARSCVTAGLRVKVVRVPDVPPKGDVSDWLAMGHSAADLHAIVQATPIHVPVAGPLPPENGGTSSNLGLQLTPLADLLAEADEPVEFVVQDRIAAGSLNLLAGKPKAGKSTASRALALAVARGDEWLGSSCVARPVWYVALEDKRSEVRRHFLAMGATGEEPLRFVFPQANRDLLGQLQTLAAQERPGLIIVDTLQRLIGAKDLNDYAEVTTKLTPVLALARESGAAVLLVHHAGKGQRPGIDAVLGSTALTGSVDNVFVLTRTDRYRLLSSMQRIGPDMPETVLSLTDTRNVVAGPHREDADRGLVETAILTALDGSHGLTEAEIDHNTEGQTTLKRRALRALVEVGRVLREGQGTKGKPYRYCLPSMTLDSCSLVPTYIREQENKNDEIAESTREYESDSRSRNQVDSALECEGREQESVAREVLEL